MSPDRKGVSTKTMSNCVASPARKGPRVDPRNSDRRLVEQPHGLGETPCRGGVALHELNDCGATGSRLESQGARAREQIQTSRTGDLRLDPVEQGFAHPIRGGPQSDSFGDGQLATTQASPDDAQPAFLPFPHGRNDRIRRFPSPVLTRSIQTMANQHDPEQQDRDPPTRRRGLFQRLRRREVSSDTTVAEAGTSTPEQDSGQPDQGSATTSTGGLWSRLRGRLARTHDGMVGGLADMLSLKKNVDDEVLEELETRLLLADVGVDATQAIVNSLTERVSRRELKDMEALLAALNDEMRDILEPVSVPLPTGAGHQPYVILMVGVNGVGKTTTIGKLAKRFLAEGRSVMLAAGDTFRAAAIEQLQAWGERNNVPVVAQQGGADSASVIYDAVDSARARGIDVLIADTAGRLHTQANLMEELRKIHRVVGKLADGAPHEVMLVVDAGTGQNALSQAVQFNAAVPLTGITLTKLDGTAKGGSSSPSPAAWGADPVHRCRERRRRPATFRRGGVRQRPACTTRELSAKCVRHSSPGRIP